MLARRRERKRELDTEVAKRMEEKKLVARKEKILAANRALRLERIRAHDLLNPFDSTPDKARLEQLLPIRAFRDMWEAHKDRPRSEGGHGTGRGFYVHIPTEEVMWMAPSWIVHRQLEARAFHKAFHAKKMRDREAERGKAALEAHKKETRSKVSKLFGSAAKAVIKSGANLTEEIRSRHASSGGRSSDDERKSRADSPLGSVRSRQSSGGFMAAAASSLSRAAALRKEMMLKAPTAASRAEKRDPRVWARMSTMLPRDLEHATERILKVQAELDCEDSPAWWVALGLRDDIRRENRGFAGGTQYAGSAAAYTRNVETQADAMQTKILETSSRRHLAELGLTKLMDKLKEDCKVVLSSFEPPVSVRSIVSRSTELTDAKAKAEHARRLAAAKLEIEKESQAAATDMLARASAIRGKKLLEEIGEEFKSQGFQGVVSEDGSILSFAGNGAQFFKDRWLARFHAKPWRLDAALVRYVMSQPDRKGTSGAAQDSDVLTDAAMSEAISAAGGAELLLKYRMGTLEDASRSGTPAESVASSRAKESKRLLGSMRSDALSSAAGLEERRKQLIRRQEAAAQVLSRQGTAGLVQGALEKAEREKAALMRARRQAALDEAADADRLECVADVAITWGHKEAAQFATAQREGAERGKPFFVCDSTDLGIPGTPVFLWYQLSDKRQEGVGDIVLAPASESSSLSKTLKDSGYRKVTHSAALGDMALWLEPGSKDGGRPVTAVGSSFDMESENRLREQGFTRLKGTLPTEFLSERAALWVIKTELPTGRIQPKDEAQMLQEQEVRILQEYCSILDDEDEGGDTVVDTSVSASLADDVEDPAQMRERERINAHRALARVKLLAEASLSESRCMAAADLLGLETAELDKLYAVFTGITRLHDGVVTLREMSRLLGCPWSPLIEAFSFFGDADMNPDAVSPSSFLRSFCVPASFGPAEVVAFLFFFAAPNMESAAPVSRARSRPESRAARAQFAAAGGTPVPAPLDYWRHATAQTRSRQRSRGVRKTDEAHDLVCMFRGLEARWSGVVTPEMLDLTVTGDGAKRALLILGWGEDGSEAALALDAASEALRSSPKGAEGLVTFVAFKRAIARRPQLLKHAATTLRTLRASIIRSSWWESKSVGFARARAVTQMRISAMAEKAPKARTAEEAFAELAAP